jgi:hypothetical protein
LVPIAIGIYVPSSRIFGLGGVDAEFGKGIGVVDEPVDHRSHRHAEAGGTIIGLPGGFGHVGEVVHCLHIVEIGQVACFEQGERGIKGAAGDQIARRARIKFGVEHRVIFRRGGGGEFHLDAGVFGFEGRDDLVLPQGQVVVAPAFDGERHILGPGRGCRQRRCCQRNGKRLS